MDNTPYLSCFPLALHSFHYKGGFRSEPFVPYCATIGIIHSGIGMLFTDDKLSSPLSEGSFFFINHNESSFELMADPGNILKLTLVHYRVIALTEEHAVASSLSLLKSDGIVHQAASALTDTLLSQLRQAMNENGELGAMRKQHTLYELLLHLIAHQRASSRNIHESIQTTLDYMEQRLSKTLQISELPQLAGMTPSSYCRAFKKMTGLTPGNYMTQLRMLKAKELMTDKHAALRDIAVTVGYQDELYFSRVFKKLEGISPSIFLKRRDRKVAVVSSLLLQDHLLALGILPIAAPSFPSYFTTPSGFPSYLHDRLQGTVALNAESPIRSSDVVHLSPDLILRTRLKNDLSDKHWGEDASAFFIDDSTSWEQYFRIIAAHLNREADAERVIRGMTSLEQEARRKLEPYTKEGEWTIVRFLPGNCRLYGVKDHAFTELFFGRLHFKHDARITHSSYINDAFDYLVELNPDQILIIWSEEPDVNAFTADARWQELKAVKGSQVYYPDSREWDPWGPIGREHMIKAMLRYFGKL